MKDYFKKIICIILSTLVVLTPLSAVVTAGDESAYPDGVTPEQVLNAVEGTDKLINALVYSTTGKGLGDMLNDALYTNETVSNTLVSVYSALTEQGGELSYIGLDATPRGVAAYLGEYPAVSEKLAAADEWSNVDLKGVDWAVTDKESFSYALASCFNPFNEILYTLMCSGTFKVNNFIKINGDDGYTNAIIPMLTSFDCKGIVTAEDFKKQADENKTTMVRNIILPVLTTVEESLSSPLDNFTRILPAFADFAVNGGFDECVDKLLEPVTSNKLVEIAILLKIFDLPSLELDLNEILNDAFAQNQNGSMKLPEIDLNELAACGKSDSCKFNADKSKAYVVIMRWFIEAIKLNNGNLDLFGGSGIDNEMLSGMLSKDTDAILKAIILLFTPSQIGEAQTMVFPSVTQKSVSYTPNLTKEDYDKVLDEIDDLLDDFVKEGGSADKMGEVIASMIYTNGNINSILKSVYSALDENGVTGLLKMLGIDITPRGVAATLTEKKFSSAVKVLSKYELWSDVPFSKLDWGVASGSRKEFQNALTASLSPLFPLMRVLLADEDFVVFDSITIVGSDGYNTAIIPLLEGLGCNPNSIKSYDWYKKHSSGEGVIKYALDPVFNLIDEVCAKPVYTITEVLPNLVYFLNSGSLEKCISNLMLPLTAVTDKFSGVVDMGDGADLSGFQIDLDGITKSMMSSSGIKLAKLDLESMSALGTPVKKQSKSIINGKSQTYTHIDSDNTAVLITLLRFLAETIKLPGNENLLMSAMSDGDAGMYGGYAESLSEQFSKMTVDELIEWLYNLFFKERVKAQLVVDDDYRPTIIFEEGKRNNTYLYVIGAYLGVCVIVGAIIFVNRKRLYR